MAALAPLRVIGDPLTPEQLAAFWRWLDANPGGSVRVQDDGYVRLWAVGEDPRKFRSIDDALAHINGGQSCA